MKIVVPEKKTNTIQSNFVNLRDLVGFESSGIKYFLRHYSVWDKEENCHFMSWEICTFNQMLVGESFKEVKSRSDFDRILLKEDTEVYVFDDQKELLAWLAK